MLVDMLASMLPGLRNIRAPLAAGYVLLLAAWLWLAPVLPTQPAETGVVADLHDLYTTVGRAVALAVATFAAYLIGVVSIELTRLGMLVINFAVWITYLLLPARIKPALRRFAAKAFPLVPSGASRFARLEAIRKVLVHRMSSRFMEDEKFRDEIIEKVAEVKARAAQLGIWLPPVLEAASAEELAKDMMDRPQVRTSVLHRLLALRQYAEDLLEEPLFASGQQAVPELFEERDRIRAEAEFRIGLALPILTLALVLVHRSTLWFLAGVIVAVALWYMGRVKDAEADIAVLHAVAEGRIEWPAADQLARGRVRYRPFAEVAQSWPIQRRHTQLENADLPAAAEHQGLEAGPCNVGIGSWRASSWSLVSFVPKWLRRCTAPLSEQP